MTAANVAASGAGMGRSALLGAKILVVEDSFLIAGDLKSGLEAACATVCGPCSTSKAALDLLDHLRPDCALLEILIGGATTVPLAEKLHRLNIPYVIVSACARDAVPGPMRDALFVRKPYRHGEVIDAVASALRGRRQQ